MASSQCPWWFKFENKNLNYGHAHIMQVGSVISASRPKIFDKRFMASVRASIALQLPAKISLRLSGLWSSSRDKLSLPIWMPRPRSLIGDWWLVIGDWWLVIFSSLSITVQPGPVWWVNRLLAAHSIKICLENLALCHHHRNQVFWLLCSITDRYIPIQQIGSHSGGLDKQWIQV